MVKLESHRAEVLVGPNKCPARIRTFASHPSKANNAMPPAVTAHICGFSVDAIFEVTQLEEIS